MVVTVVLPGTSHLLPLLTQLVLGRLLLLDALLEVALVAWESDGGGGHG